MLVSIKHLAVEGGVCKRMSGQDLAQHLAEKIVHRDLAAEHVLIRDQLRP